MVVHLFFSWQKIGWSLITGLFFVQCNWIWLSLKNSRGWVFEKSDLSFGKFIWVFPYSGLSFSTMGWVFSISIVGCTVKYCFCPCRCICGQILKIRKAELFKFLTWVLRKIGWVSLKSWVIFELSFTRFAQKINLICF